MRSALVALLLVAPGQRATEVFSWQDPRIGESSGLVDLGPEMVTTNDSGDQARLFVVDEQGATVRTVGYDASVRDVEALAPAGDGQVWVGDLGDNARVREEVAVHRVRVDGGSPALVASHRLAYADGRSYDAEALVALPDGRLAVITKGLFGDVWLAPRDLRAEGVDRLERVARVGGVVTDAAYDPEGGLVVVRGYGGASLHELPSWRRVGDLALPEQPQGEAVSVGPGGRVRVSSEGVGTPVWQLADPLPAAPATPSPPAGSASSAPPRDPSSDPASGPTGGPPSDATAAAPDPPARPVLLVGAAAAVAVLGAGVGAGVVAARRWRRRR